MKTIHISKYMLQAAILPTLLVLSACGGGGGSNSGVNSDTQTSTTSSGVMTKGSVIVNGVRYEDSTANIVLDDTPKQASSLKDGMVVKLSGRINADGISGTADNIKVENEVRGAVQVINTTALPAYIEVLGQRAYVDDLTFYDGLTGIANLTPGNPVEIHGLRDANGNLQASRIELLTGTVGLADEVRGIVSNKSSNSFKLGALLVNYTTTVISPLNATFGNGDFVEVHLSNVIYTAATATTTATATRIKLEDQENSSSTAGQFEVEGFVSGYVLGAKTFKVANRNVEINASTRFLGGNELDLMNNIKVEAEGVLNGTKLVAHKVVFKRDHIRLQGAVSAVDALTRTFKVFGKTLSVTDISQLQTASAGGSESATFADIANGDRVEVRGFVDKSGAIMVNRLEETNNNKDFIQARVATKNQAASTLGLFGVTAQLSSTTSYQSINDTPISMAAFYAAVTPASTTPPQNLGTLVKLKGTFSGTTLSVTEAELEDD